MLQQPGPVVIFDFDGTLVSRDSFVDFSLEYCLARPWRFALVGLLAPLAGLMWLSSMRRGASVLLWAMTVGASTRGFVVALRRYGTRRLPRLAHELVWSELTRRLGRGERVVIATGTAPTLVRALLRAREVPRLPVAGSRFRRRFGGLIATTHCIGRAKPRELKRRHGIEAWSTVYTDSAADYALVSAAREVILVAPAPRTLARLRPRLRSDAELRVFELSELSTWPSP
jgi:phosphatidylglycerophosphatase C